MTARRSCSFHNVLSIASSHAPTLIQVCHEVNYSNNHDKLLYQREIQFLLEAFYTSTRFFFIFDNSVKTGA